MKNIVLVILITFLGFSAFSQENLSKNAKYDVKVNGNCEMCKSRIEKAAYSVPGVKTANWHVDNETVYLIINENKTDVATIQKAIAKVGHDTEAVKATEEAYDALPECCLYVRE